MKLTVFGSTGPLGMELIKQALNAGYEVCAYARNAEKLRQFSNEKIEIIEGNLSNRSEIEWAVTGEDAVIKLLGPKGKVTNKRNKSRFI
jgi:putative NADH-flavin reductase